MSRVKDTMDTEGYSFEQIEALAAEWNGGKPARVTENYEIFDADVIHHGIEYEGAKWSDQEVISFLVWELLRRGKR